MLHLSLLDLNSLTKGNSLSCCLGGLCYHVVEVCEVCDHNVECS